MPYIQNASSFLVDALFNIALYIVLLRFWMQWVRADFRNEVGQFIIKATNPIIIPLRKIIPSIGLIDTATVVVAVLIALAQTTCLLFIAGKLGYVSIPKLVSFAIATVLDSSINVFLATIFIGIVASWINPHSYHPIVNVARSISEPILAPARQLIPAMGGIDFSPMVVILFLGFSQRLLIAPIYGLAI